MQICEIPRASELEKKKEKKGGKNRQKRKINKVKNGTLKVIDFELLLFMGQCSYLPDKAAVGTICNVSSMTRCGPNSDKKDRQTDISFLLLFLETFFQLIYP